MMRCNISHGGGIFDSQAPLNLTPKPDSVAPTSRPTKRIISIDALRGFVILLMLVDHTREFFYLRAQVADPMDLTTTPTALVLTRLTAHLCAPVFVLLTGLAASLYADARGGRPAASSFLLKRGLFLVALEWTVINFAWTFDPTPALVYLQVIWAIGLSMVVLAGLVHLPRAAVLAIGLAIALGHNLLDPITFAPGQAGHALWAVLHDRGMIDLPFGAQARTSYPILPWIGVIALGWSIGPWFAYSVEAIDRRRSLMLTGSIALLLFVLLRAINGYGDPHPWQAGSSPLMTAMSFVNVTKYPPSADFLLLTLGIGLWLLAAFERLPVRWSSLLTMFGAAPLFFYALHLLNLVVGTALGRDGIAAVSVPGVAFIWVVAAVVALPCWFACRAFAAFKRRNTGWWWRYL